MKALSVVHHPRKQGKRSLVEGSKVRFTNHAAAKFEVVKHYGFEIDNEKVVEAVLSPDRLDKRGDHYFATKIMDLKYALRVVYEERKGY